MFPSRVINQICSYLTPEEIANWGYALNNYGYALNNTVPTIHLLFDQPDHISNLPPCVKGRILSELPLKDAARTCLLSRRWRYSWSMIPTEIIIKDTSLTETELVSLIDNILSSRIGPVKTFILSDRCVIGNLQMESSYYLDKWVVSLTGGSLDVFVFDIAHPPENYCMPSNLQHCASLKTLKLRFCSLEPCEDVSLIGFNNLVNLHLTNVMIKQDSFDTIMKSCTKLESLWLQEFSGFVNLQAIYTLKILEISGNVFNIDFRRGSQVKTMTLELLTEFNTHIDAEGFSNFFIYNPLLETLWLNHFFLKYLVSFNVPYDVPQLDVL